MQTFKPWIQSIEDEIISVRKQQMLNHPFMMSAREGSASRDEMLRFFSGLLWHLYDFGSHVRHLFQKRPSQVTDLLKNRSEDQDGSVETLVRLVNFFGGDSEKIIQDLYAFRPHQVWVHHDALLRSAIYSTDFEWQVGTAALNIGIERLVPTMIGDLLNSVQANYRMNENDATWLISRSGEEEIQHGDNGYIILNEFVNEHDQRLIHKCRFYADALSSSMAFGLPQSGRPNGQL